LTFAGTERTSEICFFIRVNKETLLPSIKNSYHQEQNNLKCMLGR